MNYLSKLTIYLRQLVLISLVCVISFAILASRNYQAIAQERMFLNLSLELLDEYELPKQSFKDTPVGGLSAITYNRQKDRFYVISDDRSKAAPARFYTLKIDLKQTNPDGVQIDNINIENVTFLKNKQGKIYAQGTIDSEGIAISPRNTVFISSEGVTHQKIAPFIGEFDLNGNLKQQLRIPQRYLPNEGKGIQDNLGFEALTIKASGTVPEDAFRLFTATEAAITQDTQPDLPETKNRSRLLHYVINPIGEPVLVAEHLYLLDGAAPGVIYHGLTELTALEQEGYLLSLERSFGLNGAGAKIFQVVIGNATDTSTIGSLAGGMENYIPLKKQLLLNLNQLGIELDNLEGMTLGPRLKDGSQTLILVSDDNFSPRQENQFLLFRLNYE
jgi:hypothetical protein